CCTRCRYRSRCCGRCERCHRCGQRCHELCGLRRGRCGQGRCHCHQGCRWCGEGRRWRRRRCSQVGYRQEVIGRTEVFIEKATARWLFLWAVASVERTL